MVPYILPFQGAHKGISFQGEFLFPAACPTPTASSPWPWANQVWYPSGHFAAKNYDAVGFLLFH